MHSFKLKQKYFLDTSIFYEYLKNPKNFQNQLDKHILNKRRYAAYYSAIELNSGLFYFLVKHYKNVERMKDVSRALSELSNTFSNREPKVMMVLYSYLLAKNNKIEGNYERYLCNLEIIIMDIKDRLFRLVTFIGSFENHFLLELGLISKDDYDQFIKHCDDYRDDYKNNKESLNLNNFWYKYKASLNKMISKLEIELKEKGNLDKQKTCLLKFIKNPNIDNKYNSIGDLIIAIECTKNYQMVTKDNIFELLMSLMDRPTAIIYKWL